MLEISPLTEPDRAAWQELARGFREFCGRETSHDEYERTWRRLLDDERLRGVLARLDGTAVGLAHYRLQPSLWSADKCYLQDLFVAPAFRRRGVAQALIEWTARDAEAYGAAGMYWHTEQDNAAARALYDKVARFNGLIAYGLGFGAGQG